MYSIGIDIGGTTIKYGLVNDNCEIVERTAVKTECPQKVEAIAQEVNKILQNHNIPKNNVDKVVIGCPGLIDMDNGVVVTCIVLGWSNVALTKELSKMLGIKVEVYNDANLATMAEVKFGAGKGYNDAVLLTLGTGVGAGIVIDGKLCMGNHGMGAEIGHMLLKHNGEKCNCGRKGCFQAYASATALINQTKKCLSKNKNSVILDIVNGDINKIDGQVVLQAYQKKDKVACEIVEKYVEYLSEGIISICNFLRPEVILIGGGISNWGTVLTEKIQAHCEKNLYGYKGAPKVEIKIATLKNDAGILGCKAV